MKTRLATRLLIAAISGVASGSARADGLSPDELLAAYQPVTVLDASELFAPTAVGDFLADATLELPASPVGPAFQDDWLDPLGTIGR